MKVKQLVKKVRKQARIKSEKRYKKYYIDYRSIKLLSGRCGFARIGVTISYRQIDDSSVYDEKEENVRFLSWIEHYKKMIKTKKYNLPVKYENLQINEKRAVRLQYMKEQSMLCQYCNYSLVEKPSHKVEMAPISWNKFPKGFQKSPIHLHHNHDTEMTIGAVHMRCNAYLWQYKGE